ncbi:hypothetical protein [Burkholderia gladioli]|uniref:hypothetical protein n=1 Tax=Burkholderia gladioli TaxID=28095 RepID=UPI000FD7533D|nr:hypothetical protein [Burkholderia gladioli]MBU9424856.1 hypothetical protein [Burkholderia gladioli]MDN8061922.1 hypothetical protein [Burkholderia gladioli]QPQ88157.1 hypothetical protein I6H08_26270 [Burkholderia gladioli]
MKIATQCFIVSKKRAYDSHDIPQYPFNRDSTPIFHFPCRSRILAAPDRPRSDIASSMNGIHPKKQMNYSVINMAAAGFRAARRASCAVACDSHAAVHISIKAKPS